MAISRPIHKKNKMGNRQDDYTLHEYFKLVFQVTVFSIASALNRYVILSIFLTKRKKRKRKKDAVQ